MTKAEGETGPKVWEILNIIPSSDATRETIAQQDEAFERVIKRTQQEGQTLSEYLDNTSKPR